MNRKILILLVISLAHLTWSASITSESEEDNVNQDEGKDRVKRGFFYDSTTRGYFCEGKCSKVGGTKYFWCKVNRGSYDFWGWDYCSPFSGQDYTGAPCKDTCDYRGESYMWCNIKYGNTWGYCST